MCYAGHREIFMPSISKLKNQLQEKITPRRKRTGLIFLVIFAIYSVLGLLAAPGLVISQAQKFVQEKLKLELTIAKLEVNPWLLAVRIDGLRLKEPGAQGEILLAAKSIYVNAQLWSSLWLRGASLDEVDLLGLYVNTRIRQDGRINLMQLIPPKDPNDNSETRWRIGTFGLHNARIDIHDDSRPTPFSAFFSPLDLSLSEVSSRPNKDGEYSLHAETGDDETLDWHGTLAMQPLRSQGELKISKLKATTPWRYLQDSLPIIVDAGTISLSGRYQLTAGDTVVLSLDHGRILTDDLTLHQRGTDPLAIKLKQMDLNGVNLEWPAKTAGFANLIFQGFQVADKKSEKDLASFGNLHLENGLYNPVETSVNLATLSLQKLTLTDSDEHAALLSLPELTLKKLGIALTKQNIHVNQIVLDKGDIAVRREKNGTINWITRLDALTARLSKNTTPEKHVSAHQSPVPSSAVKGKPEKASTPWVATLGELDLLGFKINLDDNVPQTAVKNSIENLNLRIHPRQAGEDAHALEGNLAIGSGGKLAFKGRFNEHPLTASVDLDLKDLQLPPFAPYFEDIARFELGHGGLDVAGKFNFTQRKTVQADFAGRVAIHDFNANDLDQDERFLAWQNLAINGLTWQLAPGKLTIHDIQANKPFIRVIVDKDKTLNLSHIVIAAPSPADKDKAATPEKSEKVAAAKSPYPLRIDRIRMQNGSMLFADFTLNPQFATGIQSLNGDISGISTDPASRAKVALSGRVDQYGKADINGVINPIASDAYTDMSVKFTNLELATLTPYSAKFAGYRIDKGKLSLDLNYKIENRKLNATNKVIFNQLTLGEKVDSPDSVNLPLKLAVAILKDRNGVIDLDLPLSGSIDDPKFKLGPIIWKAFLNLLTKAATAPFSLIAGLVGGGDDLDSLSFATGQSQLPPDAIAKLDKITKALAERPSLAVEIRGAFDPQADALAIKAGKFNAVYEKRLADGGKPRKILEALFTEKLGSEALAEQRALHLKPASDAAKNKNELELAIESYQNSLRSELVAREVVLEGDLRQLALARAAAVRSQLVEVNKVDAAHVFVLEPVVTPVVADKVIMKITLTAS
jgi:hypothetical protein